MKKLTSRLLLLGGILGVFQPLATNAGDFYKDLQTKAIADQKAEFGHWGVDPEKYTQWRSHSNRLIPVYTFGTLGAGEGVDLNSYMGENSPYRQEGAIRRLYGRLPENTLNPEANYLDQTNVYDLQMAASKAGKKHIFLVIFDGMDWPTTRLAAIAATKKIPYTEGRGSGLHFLDYQAGGTTQYGYMVTSPHNEGTDVNVDTQTLLNPGGTMFGGYNAKLAGATPWAHVDQLEYLIAKSKNGPDKHAYTDSSSSASSMTAGIKTYNNSVNVDASGHLVLTAAHRLQEQGWKVGAVSSVPISHATPAAAYSHNVHRDDYQDLTRDMIGRPSIAHPERPLPGLDVVVAGGYGSVKQSARAQGENFIPGNVYLADVDLFAVDQQRGGKYVTSVRESGVDGSAALEEAAERAAAGGHRLLGFYGVGEYSGHLPFQTANGDYKPAPGNKGVAESYSEADLFENPTLSEMTAAAIQVLAKTDKPFWLMVESGDVDWANHDNNIDNSIGAVHSGDAAIKTITDWVEANSNWNESLLIVTADHGHLLVVEKEELLVEPAE